MCVTAYICPSLSAGLKQYLSAVTTSVTCDSCADGFHGVHQDKTGNIKYIYQSGKQTFSGVYNDCKALKMRETETWVWLLFAE